MISYTPEKTIDTELVKDRVSIFLAGSIEMGVAEKWQDRFVKDFSLTSKIVIYNPRRESWDSSWEQSINNPNFNFQVNWEMDYLLSSDVNVFYFDPNTKSPITLLELGLVKDKKHVVVCCPDGFWRKGNVEIVCKKFGYHLVDSYNFMLARTSIEITEAMISKKNK